MGSRGRDHLGLEHLHGTHVKGPGYGFESGYTWRGHLGMDGSMMTVSVRATHLASDLLICRRCIDERRAVIG
jgi:hypothetical protein